MVIKREQLVNNGSTTLNGAINDTVTSVVVNDGSVFPTTGNFRVMVDDEIMKVTARSTNTLTVVRGSEGTTAASHSNVAGMIAIVTAEGIKSLINEATVFGGTTPHKFWDSTGEIAVADFTWVNQGSATASDDANGITIKAPTNSAANNIRGLFKTAPTAPWTLTAYAMMGIGYTRGATGTTMGIAVRDTTTSELILLDLRLESLIRVAKMDSVTVVNSTPATILNESDRCWFKIEDNNTNLIFSVSADGETYVQLFSEARTTFLSPDEIGLYFNPYNITGTSGHVHFSAWVES